MTTLKQYAREMIDRLPGAIGRYETVSSLTTTTVVVSSLATGGFSAQRFAQEMPWMLRRDAASAADRLRYCTAFTSSSGTLTHAGTNYADTTATGESVELLRFDPVQYIDPSIHVAAKRTKHMDTFVLPTRQTREYSLANLDWITSMDDIESVWLSGNPVLTNNRFMRKWHTVNASGVLQPDSWTLAGTNATMARSTTNASEPSRPNLAITRSGTNCTLTQSLGLLETGVTADNMIGKTVTAVAKVWSQTASQVRVQVNDGVTTTSSSYHAGVSNWTYLATATATVGATATKLDIVLSVESSDNPVYVEDLYLCFGADSDAIRRDTYQPSRLARDEYRFNQSANTIALPNQAVGKRWEIVTKRPYPGFDVTRLKAGTADGDVSDAPLIPVTCGAIERLFGGLADAERAAEKKQYYLGIAQEWRARFEVEQKRHLAMESQKGFGLNLPPVLTFGNPGRV